MLRGNRAIAIWVLGYAGMAWAQSGAPSVEVNLGYDANGHEISQTSPLGNTTTLTRDPLGRVTMQTHSDSSTGSITYNALGQITSATDPNGVGTSYTVDALGNVLAVSNSDEGNSSATYDAAGNLLTRQDANGQTTSYTHDALGRLSRITDAEGGIISLAYDSAPNGMGKVASITEPEGSTSYSYDSAGRVSGKTQTLKNGSSHSLSYGYDSAGQLSRITYPSGRQVLYTYSLGRVTAVSTQASASAAVQPFISAIQYNALGHPLGWNWFNGDSASRSYDKAARPSSSELASYTYDEDGRITGIVQHQVSADGIQQHSNSHSIGYDNRDRVTSFAMSPGAGSNEAGYSQTYGYDTNNNRTASTDLRTTAQGTLSTLQGWTLESASNR
ncbi:RHS repeat protein, partial [Hydrogenophaga aromaticivorans]|nr:RHS repeat protein [Hydrogenophaga aromaticivorans]